MLAFIHANRGPSRRELRAFLTENGVDLNRTTAYNPAGNGLVEKNNRTMWKDVTIAYKTKNLSKYWQDALPDFLHSIRLLLQYFYS